MSFNTRESRLVCPFIPSIVQQLLRHKKGSKDMYDILNKCTSTPTGQKKMVCNFRSARFRLEKSI